MHADESFLIAMLVIFAVPYCVWRLAQTDYYAPLVVVQIVTGIVLGPGILGAAYPEYYSSVFSPPVIQSLSGVARWAVMLFVMLAGVELDLRDAWTHRRESTITAALALGTPLLAGCAVALGLLSYEGWVGQQAMAWQFVLGVGMACAVTALPVLILLMDKLELLRQPMGQRILRYASLDDVAIWAVLAVILLDWTRVGRQLGFIVVFPIATWLLRSLMLRLREADRWYVCLIWLVACGLGADWAGLHFMVGAFLAGAAIDKHWFDEAKLDMLRHHVLMVAMPVYFLSTGLRTQWGVGGAAVFSVAAVFLLASVGGKMAGCHLAGKVLGWKQGEASIIGWLLQTKALVMIVFVNILLDKHIITQETFTALLLMGVASTMLTVPAVYPKLHRLRERVQGAGVRSGV